MERGHWKALLLVLLQIQLLQNFAQGQNSLRVRNPNSTYPGSQYEGIVEVYHNGEWGTICNRNWNYHTAFIACRTAGFNSAVRAVLDATYFGGGVGRVLLDNVQCTGSEATLWHCSHSSWLDVDASCQNHVRDAAVVCSDDLALRLVGTGSSISQGRVEVSHSGQWGTICDNYWDNRDANVVCRKLGFSRGAVHAYSNAHFGSGTGQIWMDNVQCTGNETSLEDCYFRGWGIHNCSHYEDAGVVCAPDNITGDYYPVRLMVNERNSNNTPSLSYGHVEIFINGSWGTVCNDSWGIEDAQVVCRQLGFEGALSALPQSAIDQTDRNLSIYLDDVHCLGDEPALSYCIHNGIGVHNCGHYEDASVICQSMPLIQGPLYTGLSISNPHDIITLCASNC